MTPQFLNLANSSFLFWLDNYIANKGAFTTGVSSKFYSTNTIYNGLYYYQSPYSNFNYDTSVASAPVMSGVYINNNLVYPGTSGFSGIDYNRGRAWFSNNLNSSIISGTYTVKDIGILPLAISEEKLLFETKFELRKPNTTSISGLAQDSYPYPAVYVKGFDLNNTPYSFGGEDLSEISMGLFVMADSSYMADGLKSILADAKQHIIPLITADKNPFSVLGTPKNTGININYTNITSGYLAQGRSGMYIKDVTINSFQREFNVDFNKLNPNVYTFIAEFTICKPRFPRSTINNL